MRRAASALLAALLLAALAAVSAYAQAAPDVGDLPGGDGTLRGRVLQAEGGAASGVDVSLIAFTADGSQGLRRTTSDADGRFGFDAIDPDPKVVYFVVAQSGGVHHSERSAFSEASKTLDVEVRIAPTSANTRLARRGEASVRLERSCSGLRVTETHALSNRTRSVIFVDAGAREGAQPILDLELPEAAGELASPFGANPTGLERDGRRVRFWGPLYPGAQELEFSYTLPADGDTLSARWVYPTGALRLAFLADPSLPEVSVEPLRERAAREVFERAHRSFETTWLANGAAVEVSVQLGAAPPLAALREAQLWIELDDASLEVDERIAIEPDPAASDASLLCLALPPEATDLRFSQSTLSLPVARDAAGSLELRGPLPAGEQTLTLRYRLPAGAEKTRFARRFGVDLPLLGVLVSDTGVVPETTRLHRRRPVRRVERNYLHLEGFQIDADETVEIDFTRLPAPSGLPRSATAGFAVLVAGGLLLFLGGPLRRADGADPVDETQAERLAAERESVYAAIRDLDEDFDTGKLTREDHAQLRDELRARAVRLLEREQRGEPTAPDAAAAKPTPNLARPYSHPAGSYGAAREKRSAGNAAHWRFCPACGGELPPQPRFCPHCGERMPGGDEASGGA